MHTNIYGDFSLCPQMIIVASPSKPFEYTSKGTPRRHFMTARYDQEIQALYDTVRESAQIDISVPEDWTEEFVLQFVGEVVRKVMKRDVPADADIFQQGCDRSVLLVTRPVSKFLFG